MELKINKNEESPKLLLDFLKYLYVIKGYSINTVNGYKLDLLLFFYFIKVYHKLNIGIKNFNIFILAKVKTSDIIAFLVYLNFERDNSWATRQRKLVAIRSFYKWLTNSHEKNINKNPANGIESIKKVERMPKYIELEKAKKLQNIFTIENCNFPQRNNAIICLFLATGMRLHELINIKLSDINLMNNTIKIKGKGNKERTVYFNKFCNQKIKNYLETRKEKESFIDENDFLFINNKQNRLGIDGVEYICKKAYKLAGLEGYGYTTHTLRHTAATTLYKYVTQDILVLKEFLGHESIVSTEIYTHVSNKELIKAVNNHPLNSSN